MSETILVFPAGMPDALRFRARAAADGCTVVGASSLKWDTAEPVYDAFDRLPYVHEDAFPAALGELVARRGVDAIYAPHEVVARRLGEVLGEVAPRARLIEGAPLSDGERGYRDLQARAAALSGEAWFVAPALPPRPPLSPTEAAGVLRLVETVPGMCDDDKVAALFEVMRHAPQGDVVEIGSWWGRSAALLLLLARRHRVGPVLCVDPWAAEALPQGVDVLDRASAALDTDEALRIFEINLAPLAAGDLNRLRATSAVGAACYGPGLEVETETFGATRYGGEIALLHIDGNHAFERVEEDARLWTPFVRPGGWIVFDDYVWAFGDGPKRVGDVFLEREADRIALSFVMGTALFVQLLPSPLMGEGPGMGVCEPGGIARRGSVARFHDGPAPASTLASGSHPHPRPFCHQVGREIVERGWALFPHTLDGPTLATLRADAERLHTVRRRVQEANGVSAGMEGIAHHVLGEGSSLDAFVADLPLHDEIERFFDGRFILLNFGATLHPPGSRAYTAKPHRDVRAFSPGYPLSLNMLVMLDDFTEANGATRVLEGSHRVEALPDAETFERGSYPLTGRAGDIVLFDSLLVHSAAPNTTDAPRRALTLCFGRPFMKPQMDWPRFLPPGAEAALTPCARQLLGYDARVAASLDEYYQPPERWTFKADQR